MVTSLLEAWYRENKRPLPWRLQATPYHVWLSEVILQQTRVAQGVGYYQRFIKRFPSLASLAAAREDEVLSLWQGLGYYSRARHLHQCAQQLMQGYGGEFPRSAKELEKLPGIGGYTAAAIASICYGERVAAVDGNVYRVLARLANDPTDPSTPAGKRHFQEMAHALVPAQGAGSYNQAIMEFGALHCTPKQPKCLSCPLQPHCRSFAAGTSSQLPSKARRKPLRERQITYLIIHYRGGVFLKKRSAKDIWHGLYDFYAMESTSSASHTADPLLQAAQELAQPFAPLPAVVRHLLTHQRLFLTYTEVFLQGAAWQQVQPLLQERQMGWVPYGQLDQYPLPKPLERMVAEALPRWLASYSEKAPS